MKLQEEVEEFCKKHGLESPAEHRVLDLVSEVGELSKEILKISDYGRKDLEYKEEIGFELGDVFYSLITVANSFDVDLEEALEKALEKYESRMDDSGPGS